MNDMVREDIEKTTQKGKHSMSEKIVRAEYRAYLKENISGQELKEQIEMYYKIASSKKEGSDLLTAAMFQYERNVFLYIELIEVDEKKVATFAEELFPDLNNLFEIVPGFFEKRCWVYMTPVFWFDTPENLQQWKRIQKAGEQCGRIAILYHEKLLSYVCHHQSIVNEGLLKGDRYQFISFHENVLFSYYEEPRDREIVNVKKMEGDSKEIALWEQVNPESHFYHFPEAEGANFLKIPSLFTIG